MTRSLIGPFIVALLVTAAASPAVRLLARWVGAADPASERHPGRGTAVPGGIAIFAGFLLGTLLAVLTVEARPTSILGPLRSGELGIIVGATILLAAGVVADVLHPGTTWKLIAQGIAGAAVVTLGVVYPLTPWMWANIIITIFWFIALINALSLLDKVEGAAAGVMAISALFLAGLYAWDGEWVYAALCAAGAGAMLGFLPYAFPPASVRAGDSGILLIGGLLAGLAAAYPATASGTVVALFLVPVILVAVPVVDAVVVATSRALTAADTDPAADRFDNAGLSRRQSAAALYGLALLGGGIALAVRATGVAFGASVGVLYLIGLALLGAYLLQLQAPVDSSGRRRRLRGLVRDLVYKRRAAEILLDMLLFAIAYYGGHLLRYDGDIPPDQVRVLERTMAVAVVMKSIAFGISGIYRGVWRQMGAVDLLRLTRATVLASLLTAAGLVFFFRDERFARGMLVIDGLLVALLTIGVRGSFLSMDVVRRALGSTGQPTLIYGAGRGGEMVLHEIDSNREVELRPVGFIDDAPTMQGRLVQGLPVLGGGADLARLVRDRHIAMIVISTRLERDRRDALVREAERMQLGVLEFQVRLEEVVTGPAPAAMWTEPR